ncbi:hypothetical protein Nepgr_001474 [Nepenthes gracilis]|uniref:Pentatricopeptide repeat-containing protein n=1 Tax=Nepenthes gracilis TaxID=150966 RepID=A0AAD3P636_NEPGR|nr:hypothetical protein Nepgr_001474 [Nepenthes gracilis]
MKVYILMAINNVIPDVVTHTLLLKPLAAKGELDEAVTLFFKMFKQDVVADSVAYCTLMDGLCKKNKPAAGLWNFELMTSNRVKPDIIIYIILVRSLFQVGRLKDALS